MTRALVVSAGLAGLLCVDVKIDRDAYLGCLNEMFREASRPAPPAAAMEANPAVAPAPAVGTYNRAAIAEMLGQSFGHSVFPQRPAVAVPPHLPR